MNFSFSINLRCLTRSLCLIKKFHDGFYGFPLLILDPVKIVNMSKFNEKIGELIGDIELRPTLGLSKAPLGLGPEHPSEGMML